jgi:hypothetical protein
MVTKYSNMYLPLQDPPKFTQIGILKFLKICHLATPTPMRQNVTETERQLTKCQRHKL